MAQYGRPSSDISTGLWTTTPLYSKLDETPYSDTDYITSTKNATGDIFEELLSSVSDPFSSANHIIRVRLRCSKSSNGTATLYLYQGTTLIATYAIPGYLATGFTTYEYTLSAGEANSITDYSDLRIRIDGSCTANAYDYCSWIEFECPDAGATQYELWGNKGSFIETGNDSKLLCFRQIRTDPGIYSEIGSDAYLLNKRLLHASLGTFDGIYSDAILINNRNILADGGAFVLTGRNAILTYVGGIVDYYLWAGAGVFALSGQDAILLSDRLLMTVAGSFIEIGNNSILLNGRLLITDAGIFIETAHNAYLLVDRITKAAKGIFTLTGEDAILIYTTIGAYYLYANTGSFVETAPNAILLNNHLLRADNGDFVLTGKNAYLISDFLIRTASGVFIETGNKAILIYSGVTDNYYLYTETGIYTLTGNDAMLYSIKLLRGEIFVTDKQRNKVISYEHQVYDVSITDQLTMEVLKG
jgi:hypothetical protein